jgi:hypothetical protein
MFKKHCRHTIEYHYYQPKPAVEYWEPYWRPTLYSEKIVKTWDQLTRREQKKIRKKHLTEEPYPRLYRCSDECSNYEI